MERPSWIDNDLYPFAPHWLDIDGHAVHYVDEGPRDAPVLLFVHPGPGWSFTWRAHIRALAGRFRCIAPDLPGHGPSRPAPGYTFTLQEHATVLEAFVARLDLRHITLWGNDAGGPTGMLVAGRDPDRFSRLVMGGTFGWDIRSYPEVTRFLRIVTGPVFRWFNRRTNLLARTQRRLAFGTRSLSIREAGQYRHQWPHPTDRDRTLLWFRSFTDADSADELESNLARLRTRPCLILFGDGDPMFAQGWHDRWAQEFPDHTLHVLPGVKHFTFEDAPRQTVDAFLAWDEASRPAAQATAAA